MSKVAVVSGRVEPDLAAMLDRLSLRMDRPKGWIVAKAVADYVTAESALLDSLDEAERQIDRGEFHTQAEVEAWAASLRGSAAAQ